jgi:hypothetical protein
VAVTAVETA